MKKLTLFILAALTLGLTGCAVLTASDTAAIDAASGNATEWNNRIQATTQPSADLWSNVQAYSKTNADSWSHMSNIAHQVATQPAGGN